MKKTRPSFHVQCFALLSAFAAPLAFAAECGLNEVAFPVDAALWPENFSPVRPGQAIDVRRDSTDYITQTTPNYTWGHELYKGIAFVGNYMFTGYSGGIQAWNVDPNDPRGNLAELPEFVAFRDGWLGHFLDWGVNLETDSYVEEVDAIRLNSDEIIVAASGRNPVGFTLWKFRESTEVFERVYQHGDEYSYQVRLVNQNGKIYAFSARPDGVNVYDVNEALDEAPCLELPTANIECRNVLIGKVGTALTGAVTTSQAIDVLQTTGFSPKLFLSVTDGINGTAVKVDIFEIANPDLPQVAIRKVSGLSSHSFGTAMFEHNGNYYLGVVERIGVTNKLKIFNINACINGSSCSFGAPLAQFPLLGFTSRQYLTFSRSGTSPFLYYGGIFNNLTQTESVEMLLDLSALQPTGTNQQGNLPEITGDRTITESAACGSSTVDYWGWYYPNTEFGYRHISPRRGKFNGKYFYRAAYSLLDIHQLSGPIVQLPEITTSVQGNGPFWMNDEVRFTAAAENCDDPLAAWTWDVNQIVPAGNEPFQVIGTGNQVDINFDYCTGPELCPDRTLRVTPDNAACVDPTNNGYQILIQEPRAEIEAVRVAIGGGDPEPVPATVNVCTDLEFSAIVDGRPLVDGQFGFRYDWELLNSLDEVVASASGVQQTSLSWEAEFSSSLLFQDGFESGNISLWGIDSTDPETYRLRLTVENSPDSSGTNYTTPLVSESFVVEGLDPLGFDLDDPILVPGGALGGTFEANSLNATSWRWIIEDPNGVETDCTTSGGSLTGYATCTIVDWATDTKQIDHQWAPGTPSGTYGVTVEARNCEVQTPMVRSSSVTITGVVLEITGFDIDVASSSPACDNICQFQDVCGCRPNQDITFDVSSTGSPVGYQFDWEGNNNWTSTLAATGSYDHSYSSNGQRSPRVRAVSATEVSDPFVLKVPASGDTDQSINIQP